MSENTTQMSVEEAQAVTNEIKTSLTSIAELVHKAMLGQAHLALGYKTVAAWADAELGYSRSRAYQLFNWQHSVSYFIDYCELAEDWSMVESDLRGYTGKKLEAMVESCMEATADVTDQKKRGQIVRSLILKENRERKAALSSIARAMGKAADNGVAANDSVNAVVPPIVKTTTRISGFSTVPVSLEYARVKVADTATMLTAAAAVDTNDIDSLLAPLQDARTALDGLIASIQIAGESK